MDDYIIGYIVHIPAGRLELSMSFHMNMLLLKPVEHFWPQFPFFHLLSKFIPNIWLSLKKRVLIINDQWSNV